ncbi:hypothetical protein [Chondromyces crocatus]|uniref:Trimethylguanosine synthase n=1 Tax=Chondromyces crocatus TaxID=52 RepID=A0A0K1EBK0_CHOCO|nr:hypothetical protein [Chondromyces crocatus]AKT38224.1 uncharacterized protein CMC5_023670 [Chondromyces crocatus]
MRKPRRHDGEGGFAYVKQEGGTMEQQDAVCNGAADYWRLRDELLTTSPLRELHPGEIGAFSRSVYGCPEAMALYGVPPSRMAATGLKILGRIAVECTVDMHGSAIANTLYTLLGRPRRAPDMLVADLFCGAGNVGYHIGRRLGVTVQASEGDAQIHAATRHNLEMTKAPVALDQGDYRDLLDQLVPRGPHDTYIVEPGWGTASSREGLDLGATSPPLREILKSIRRSRSGKPFLLVIKTNDRILRDSLRAALTGGHHLHTHAPAPRLPRGANAHHHLYALPA